MTDPQPVEAPLLRIVKGDPTSEEIAALVAVVSALASAGNDAPAPPRSEWAAPRRALRRPIHHGPSAWRASGH